jgi:hypothetical protein
VSVFVLALSVGCVDYGFALDPGPLSGGEALIRVDPMAIGFGGVEAGETRVQPITVTSVGTAILDVSSLVLNGQDGFSLVSDPSPFSLDPGESLQVEVEFQPMAPGLQEAVLIVASSDSWTPEVSVDLTGEGLTPYLVITPETHTFGDLLAGCEEEVRLTFQNTGNADLVIEGTTHAEGLHFEFFDGPEMPLTLGPGAATSGWVRFLPLTAGDLSDQLWVDSTDPRGQQTVSQSGVGLSSGSGLDQWTVPAEVPVDLLFAVDRSGSMDDDAQALADNFEAFIAAVEVQASDWQLGVVTLDEGCFNEGVLTASTPDLDQAFRTAVTTGEDLDIVNDEALFQLVDAALARSSVGLCNAGFSRPNTPLHVVVISDEPERSTEVAAAWTWDHWLASFADHLPAGSTLTVSGVIDLSDCNEGSAGYAEAISASGGAALDICVDDWADHVAALAELTLAKVFTFPLSANPQPETVQVTVDGSDWLGAWAYDETANAVVVQDLTPGQQVEASYALYVDCN